MKYDMCYSFERVKYKWNVLYIIFIKRTLLVRQPLILAQSKESVRKKILTHFRVLKHAEQYLLENKRSVLT